MDSLQQQALPMGLQRQVRRPALPARRALKSTSHSTEAGSLLTYDEEMEPISAVGLVAPKKGALLTLRVQL